MPAREFDLVLFGASGYVGGLIAKYLGQRLAGTELKCALAGRTRGDVEPVLAKCGLPRDLPILEADADDDASLDRLCARTAGIISTVGPYQKVGSKLVRACAEGGTDYADLSGEPAWMRFMIDAHQAAAQASGASILFSCGYDSVPFDLGVFCLQEAARKQLGRPLSLVEGRIRATKGGGFSGGTAASLALNNEAAEKDQRVAELMSSPFALCPGFDGPAQPDGDSVRYDETASSWAAPFIMSTINTKNVHRTNFILGHTYGKDFRYDEMTLAGEGDKGRREADQMAERAKKALSNHDQGDGPSEEDRKGGFYDILFHGDRGELRGAIKGEDDPGYGSTAKMIAEIAILQRELSPAPGIATPASAFGSDLIRRFAEQNVMHFELEVSNMAEATTLTPTLEVTKVQRLTLTGPTGLPTCTC